MTEKDQGHFGPKGSNEETPPSHGSKGTQQDSSDFTGIRNSLEESLRDLDSLKATQTQEQTRAETADIAEIRSKGNKSRDSFERLLREGSNSPQRNNAGQVGGCISLLLILSFMISLAFPLFWIVFALILLGVLASSGREWMG